MLGQSSGVHVNMCPEIGGFNWKIIISSKYPNYVIFLLTTDSTFTIHVPCLITVEFLSFIKVPVHNKCLKCPTRVGTSDHGLSHPRKAPRAVANGLTGKVRWWSVFPFSVWTWHTRDFLCSHGQKYEGLRFDTLLGCTSKTVCRHLLIWIVLFCGEHVSDICPCLLDALCICLCFGMRYLNMLACVASRGQPSVAVECLESLRVHVRGWRPAFGWGLSLSPRFVCPCRSAAAIFFMLATVGHCYNLSHGQRAPE